MLFERNLIKAQSRAFTLPETVITLAVVGILAALTVPQMYKNLPRQEDEIHKKVTYTLEQTVANMFEDEQMYPRTSDDLKEGFQNTDKVFINGVAYGSDDPSNDTARKAKFCKLFASKFKKRARHEFSAVASTEVFCTAAASDPSTSGVNGPTFITTDGAFWYVPITDFADTDNEGVAKITVDVNGLKGPNQKSGDKQDQFEYYIKYNGTITEDNPTTSKGQSREFRLQINRTTKNRNNQDVTASTGGYAKLFECDETGTTCSTFSPSTGTNFTNLKRGLVYRIEAKPTTDAYGKKKYTSNWPDDKKVFKVTNKDVVVNLTFREIPTSKITLVEEGCPVSFGCGTVTFRTGCKYKKVTSGTGVFKYDAEHDTYVYAGINDPGADYNYECTGTKTYTSRTSSPEDTYTWSSLQAGDYSIEIQPKTTAVSGKKYTIPNIKNNKFVQSARLGTVDLKFKVKYEEKEEE